LALGLIGGLCFLSGKKESNDKFEVIEDGMVQLWEDGPYWAAKNIGADKPEDPGYYFWWGDTVGYERENNSWVANDESRSNFSFDSDKVPTSGIYLRSILEREGWVGRKNGTYVLTSKHDAAQAHWGGDWRMPTKDEFEGLKSTCDWIWTTRKGRNGYVVRGKGDYASKSIFLPCAGYGYGTSLRDAGSSGFYWSSVPFHGMYCGVYCAWSLCFDSCGHDSYAGISDRSCGRPVRPVQGFTK
jgi:hypothetical protein